MTGSRSTSPAELLVSLRRDDRSPMHQQLERELRAAIRSGRLAPEAALPATRTLASQLGLSRGVIVEAYEQLVAEGYLTSRHGGDTWVAPRGTERGPGSDARPAPAWEPRIDFSYGHPDVTQTAWLRSLRRVLTEAPSARLGYLDARGAPELRDALAGYLNRVRGTEASADRIVITNGFAQALSLTLEVVKAMGGRRIGAEDPGQTDTAVVVRRHVLELAPVPVDQDGLVVEALERAEVDAVVVTPAHEFPTGAVMSAERRAALVAWAEANGGVIVEDDYDAEYRYDREPIGAVQGLAPESVLYAGSASKTLAPGLRLGWLICPARLVGPIAEAKDASDRGSAGLEQLAFADFLGRGEFDRHLRRMRPIYRRRRDALLDGLRRDLPTLRPVGASAGLHVAAWLPSDVDEAALIARAAGLGVRISGLSRYHFDPARIGGGLLFGYGGLSEAEIMEGTRLMARALAAR